MKVAFRVDAGKLIGSGHVMRCLAFAERLSLIGAQCYFITRAHEGHMAHYIAEKGYILHLLPPRKPANRDCISWLGATTEEDAEDTISALSEEEIDWLVIDHFAIEAHWETLFRARIPASILVIDGQANRPHVCDALIDPAFSTKGIYRWRELLPEVCKVWIGPQLDLLRLEFERAASSPLRCSAKVSRILLSFGGVDSNNVTEKLLHLCLLEFPDMSWDVLVGEGNPHINVLLNKFSSRSQVHLHIQPSSVSSLMQQAQLALTAGGGTVWELFSIGVPCLIVCTAQNQNELVKELDKAGYAQSLGDVFSLKNQDFINGLRRMINDADLRARLCNKAHNLIKEKEIRPSQYMMENF